MDIVPFLFITKNKASIGGAFHFVIMAIMAVASGPPTAPVDTPSYSQFPNLFSHFLQNRAFPAISFSISPLHRAFSGIIYFLHDFFTPSLLFLYSNYSFLL